MGKQKTKNPDEANILLRIHKDIKAELEISAKANGRSINSELLQAIKAWLNPITVKVNRKSLTDRISEYHDTLKKQTL